MLFWRTYCKETPSHSHLNVFILIHTIFSVVFPYFVHLAIHSSLFSQPVGPFLNMATSRINVNIFNHLVWQKNWGAAAEYTATFNLCSEIGWTWLPAFKNLLEGKPLLESNFGCRYNYRLVERETELWPSDTNLFSEQHSANKQSSQAL